MAAFRNGVLLVLAVFCASITALPTENMLPPWRIPQTPTPTPSSAADFASFAVTTPTPGANCTTTLVEGVKFGALQQPTCTFYESYTTVTQLVDCGGCALEINKIEQGHGPVVRCGTNIDVPLGTTTVTSCSGNNTIAPPTPTPTTPTDYEPVVPEGPCDNDLPLVSGCRQ